MDGEWKSGRIKKILISLLFVWFRMEKWRNEKVSLYKFTYTPLLKNDSQLKQKIDKQPKKNQSSSLLKNKNHVPKKNHV